MKKLFWLAALELPEHVYQWLKALADRNERSMAAQARWMLAEAAEADGYKPVSKPADDK